jgi:hypothetical protein
MWKGKQKAKVPSRTIIRWKLGRQMECLGDRTASDVKNLTKT